jgi:hypothetical protein
MNLLYVLSDHPAPHRRARRRKVEGGLDAACASAPSVPKKTWMTFQANPVSFVLRPLRTFAACVRKHGVPTLADPKVVEGHVVLMLPRGLTRNSPRLKKAKLACQKLLPKGPGQPGTGPTMTGPGPWLITSIA